MPRSPALANQIADALVEALKRIHATLDAGSWLTEPKEVRRGFLIESVGIRRPAMLVQVGEWSDQQIAGPRHETQLQLLVHCVSEGNELGEKLLNDMAADVIEAVARDHSLAGLVEDATVTNYRPDAEIAQRSGFGLATVFVQAVYKWSHGDP